MTLTDSLTTLPFLGANNWSAPQAFATSQAGFGLVDWAWRDDVVAGRVLGLGTCPGINVGDCKTYGAVFARVDAGFPSFSTRDSQHMIRDSFALYETPKFTITVSVPLINPLIIDGCINCGRWLNPFDRDPVDLIGTIRTPSPIFTDTNRVLTVVNPARALDITGMFDAPSRARLAATNLSWFNAAESRRVIREQPVSIATPRADLPAVMLPSTLNGDVPSYVLQTARGVQIVNVKDSEFPPGPQQQIFGGPASQSGVTGVYSATERAVYVVGGRTAANKPANVIWRWDMGTSHYDAILTTTKYAPSSTVLGVAYDSARQRLYVLDVDDNDAIGPQRWARLLRYEMATGVSTETLRIPYLAAFSRISLTSLEDGSLALLAGTALSYTAWRVDASGPIAAFLGVKAALGRVIQAPIMGEDRLYLPVQRGPLVVLDELPNTAFLGGLPCTSL